MYVRMFACMPVHESVCLPVFMCLDRCLWLTACMAVLSAHLCAREGVSEGLPRGRVAASIISSFLGFSGEGSGGSTVTMVTAWVSPQRGWSLVPVRGAVLPCSHPLESPVTPNLSKGHDPLYKSTGMCGGCDSPGCVLVTGTVTRHALTCLSPRACPGTPTASMAACPACGFSTSPFPGCGGRQSQHLERSDQPGLLAAFRMDSRQRGCGEKSFLGHVSHPLEAAFLFPVPCCCGESVSGAPQPRAQARSSAWRCFSERCKTVSQKQFISKCL